MESILILAYLVVGIVIGGYCYHYESKKLNGNIDVSAANIAMTFVVIFWPVAVIVWIIPYLIRLIKSKNQ